MTELQPSLKILSAMIDWRFVLLIYLLAGSVDRHAVAGEADKAPAFVGSSGCQACHQAEYQAWQGSHHQRAMQEATAATVLGDFSGAEFTYNGLTSRFYVRGGDYFVFTDGVDGKMTEFAITHTFGVDPLQQYLVSLPGGRLQALSIAWDSRPRAQGGQRWFHLYPDEAIGSDDELHWTGLQMNWNYMCADCHSTNLEKKYQSDDRRFKTTWSEIHVGCEACHGPGSSHVTWAGLLEAERGLDPDMGLSILLRERQGVHWPIQAESNVPQRSTPNRQRREIDVCAACHSRRSLIDEGIARGGRFLDHYQPALLREGLYHPDGQILDEVYVWGSFVQSRMHAAGVTCSDCHEPHSMQLLAPGDAVCARCHVSSEYASPDHHHHPVASAGARCVGCHMPEKSYMLVDPRRDHSLRIPRPDLSAEFGTPDACTQCHQDQDSAWASHHFRDWYPDPAPQFQTWTSAFIAARNGNPAAGQMLVELIKQADVPAIARATAVLELEPFLDAQTAAGLQTALSDDSPLVRMAAVRVLEALPPEAALPYGGHLLQDDFLVVRLEAASVLAGAPRNQMNVDGRALLDQAVADYVKSQRLHADRPENRVNLGNLYVSMRQPLNAEQEFRAALELESDFTPAFINLADLYRAQRRDDAVLEILQAGLEKDPGSAALHHSLGLALVRQGQETAALSLLSRAAEIDPSNARFAYVAGVAMNSAGNPEEAIAVLQAALAQHPGNAQILFALVTINRDLGQITRAREWAAKLLALNPANQQARALLNSLKMSNQSP